MSRAHMIYNETSHDAVTHTGSAAWSEKDAVGKAPGRGFVLEAEVLRVPDRATAGGKRYALLHLRFRQAFRRRFDPDGTELETWKKEEKKVNKGYLNKVDQELRHDYAMKFEEVFDITTPFVAAAGLPAPHSRGDNSVDVLIEESRARSLDLIAGQRVRLKSLKDTAMVESIAVIDSETKATTLNYVGAEATGEGWTDKLQRKGGAAAEPLPGEDLEGVDDDEWGDDDDDDDDNS